MRGTDASTGAAVPGGRRCSPVAHGADQMLLCFQAKAGSSRFGNLRDQPAVAKASLITLWMPNSSSAADPVSLPYPMAELNSSVVPKASNT